MADQGLHKINTLRRNWIICRLLADVLFAATVTALILIVLMEINYVGIRFLVKPWLSLAILISSIAAFLLIRKPWKISRQSVAAFLNRTYPDLEESAELTIKPTDELSLLQKLQLNKIDGAIQVVPALPKIFVKRLIIAAVSLTAAITLGNLLSGEVVYITSDNIVPPLSSLNAKENVLPQISALKLTIHPPAYTGKSSHEQDKFTILAEEGSSAHWTINTNITVKHLSLLFNDHERVALKPNAGKTEWTTSKTIDKPGFYQVNVDGKLSDLYQIETIKDAPPAIKIKTPKQYTYIDAGEAPRVNLTTTINDDYGVSDAMIHATVAKGSGEAVKFKEYQIPFGDSFAGHNKEYNLQHVFDLPKLDMEPGDELYFFIEAQDNHQQKSRTDVFTVSIQDTAALLSMDGIVNGSDLKPEYFRSQRQIIMDTEKLLNGKDSMSRESFNTTAGNIGIDQKMLRLRYGKFLGEEDESNVGGPPEGSELDKAENFSNGKMILDAMTDKHDNAEDATYLDPTVKAQLRATLTEMWNAELHLRIYKPQEALPFEYKALRLLKDLQQKSRAYVAKTTYKTSPLKMEKRLTGDLTKVEQPLNQQTIKPGTDAYEAMKNAVQVLEQIKLTRIYNPADKHILQLAKQQLSVKASAQPGIYLPAVSAMNRVIAADHPAVADVQLVEHAIQKSLPAKAQLPQGGSSMPDMGLSQHYYQNLKRKP